MNVRDRLWDVKHFLWPVLITLVAAGLRFYGLGHQSLWSDEGFSIVVASVPSGLAWEALLTDVVHPPLYYLLLRVALFLGPSEVALRLPSVLVGILTIPLFYALALRITRRREVALLSSLLLALSPFHIWYSQEARMYALFVFLCIVVMYTFVCALDTGGIYRWGGFVLASALAYNAHYFALFLALIQFVFLVITLRQHYRALRVWVLAQAVAFVPVALWLLAVYSRESTSFGIGWIPQPGPIDLVLTLWNFSFAYSGTLAPWVVVGLALMWGAVFYSVIGREACPSSGRTLALLWLLLPLLLSLLLSLIVPLYADRFLIFTLPAYLLLVSCGVMKPKSEIARGLWAGLVVVFTLISVVNMHVSPVFAKEDWRGLAAYLQRSAQATDVIVLRHFQYKFPFEYYHHGQADQEVLTTNTVTRSLAKIADGHSRLWLVYRGRHESSHHLALVEPFDLNVDELDPTVLCWLESHEDSLLEQSDRFPGLYLFVFALNLER